MPDYKRLGRAMSKFEKQKASLTGFRTDRDILAQKHADTMRETEGIFGLLGLGVAGAEEISQNYETTAELSKIEKLEFKDERGFLDKMFGTGEVEYGPDGKKVEFEDLATALSFMRMKGHTEEYSNMYNLLSGKENEEANVEEGFSGTSDINKFLPDIKAKYDSPLGITTQKKTMFGDGGNDALVSLYGNDLNKMVGNKMNFWRSK